MESNDQLIGKQLGTCVLECVIGAGGMGMVYLAHQRRPVRDVAVKVLRSGAGLYTDAHQEFLARFRREANVIARLDHINILSIYGYDEQDGLAYLVMPYLTGGSLRTLLEERGKLSPQEAFKYIEQAGAALQYAHEHQVVHRDIKPGNMLFHADGRLVLVDFGIARIARDHSLSELSDPSLTAVGQFLGSAEYMAPEMVQGHKVDHRADLYELGIVLFQMLVGRVPFQGGTVLSIAAKHINESPQSLVQLDASISPALDAVVQKVLSKDPEERYASAREFVEALHAAISPAATVVQDLNTYAGNQYSLFMVPDSASAPTVQVSLDTHYQFETSHSNRARLPSHPSLKNSSNLQNNDSLRTFEPNDTSYNTLYIPQGDMPYFSSSNKSQENMLYSLSVDIAQENRPSSSPNTIESTRAIDVSHNNLVPKRSSKSHTILKWLLALCGVIVLGIIGLVFVPSIVHILDSKLKPTPAVVVTTTPMLSEKAKAVVQLYYNDINHKKFTDAYRQLSVTSQLQRPYPDFVKGYAHTRRDDITYGSTDLFGSGRYQCNVTIKTVEQDDKGKIITTFYAGYYVLGPDHGALKILPATFIYAKK